MGKLIDDCALVPENPPIKPFCDYRITIRRRYVLKNDCLYIDGQYVGYVIEANEKSVTIKYDNKNIYMQGQTITINLV